MWLIRCGNFGRKKIKEMDNETVSVELDSRSYDIVVGDQLMQASGKLIAPLLRQPRVILISDTNVSPIYKDIVLESLTSEGVKHESLILPAGEGTKNFKYFVDLVNSILSLGIERGTSLIALGGGVIGDIVGYAAASLLRGIDFIQIPTTLLAQVDSSVGGKTGINTVHGKNLVGAFHQPRLVLCDIGALDTLPERELRAGYAEVVKYGLIADKDFFNWLEDNGEDICKGDRSSRQRAVVTSCEAKASIVAKDEKESGPRALLNFGHTFGHALEAETGFGDVLLHGEAVSIGMVMALTLSTKLGYCEPITQRSVQDHLRRVGLPVSTADRPNIDWDADALLNHMAKDKKVTGGVITLVLARRIGEAFLCNGVDRKKLITVLESGGKL